MQPNPTNLGTQQSMSRLKRVISTDDACKVYNNFANLPRARFASHILTLPCIIHHVQVVKQRQTSMNHHTYDVQAVGLRPIRIIAQEELKECMGLTRSPYALIHLWDGKLLDYLEADNAIAGYKVLMKLEKPFIALMLQRLPEGGYKRICTSHFVIALANGPASIVNSEITTLDIVA
ncbi:hypothetical protein ID866_9380 [Astraeus odoratus]|nr:hypothetical protein ID866_9380 [Astraeus odoratus]